MAYGRGFRGGYGFGRGFRRGFVPRTAIVPSVFYENPVDELTALKQQSDFIKNTMDSINQRIAELEKAE
jgi:hypothetical protein